MTTLRKLAMLACVGLVAGALIACGDDDNPSQPDSGIPDTGPLPDSGPPTDAPTDTPDGGGPNTFPAYVQSLIETKTSENGTPDLEAVWGTLPDDDKYVYPATFFP